MHHILCQQTTIHRLTCRNLDRVDLAEQHNLAWLATGVVIKSGYNRSDRVVSSLVWIGFNIKTAAEGSLGSQDQEEAKSLDKTRRRQFLIFKVNENLPGKISEILLYRLRV